MRIAPRPESWHKFRRRHHIASFAEDGFNQNCCCLVGWALLLEYQIELPHAIIGEPESSAATLNLIGIRWGWRTEHLLMEGVWSKDNAAGERSCHASAKACARTRQC